MHGLCREFLTGFRKRKQQRTEEKKAKREEREKRERREERRQVSTFILEPEGGVGTEFARPESTNARRTSGQERRTGGGRLRW